MAKTVSDINAFAAVLPAVTFGSKKVIFREGEKGENAYIVLKGEVIICTQTDDGELVHLTTLKRGQLFGELALLNEFVRTATAITEVGCELLVVRPALLRSKFAKADPIMKFWVEYLSERVVDLSKRVAPTAPPNRTGEKSK